MIKISTDTAPAAIGPYSQALRFGNLLFCSGQVPLDPATGQLVEGGIEPQTRRVLENLKAVVAAGGSSLSQVAKTTVFVVNLADYATINQIYAEYFQDPAPARSAVQVAALPKGALVEIEAIATVGD